MSDTTKSVYDELDRILTLPFIRGKIHRAGKPFEQHDLYLPESPEHYKELQKKAITQLFTKQLEKAEIRARIDESTPNASDDSKAVRVHVPQRNHINGTDYDKGWNDCWEAFWSARWKRVGELAQNTKGGTDDTPRI